jgi:uncharacterized protein YjbJ (UPF0337 family)
LADFSLSSFWSSSSPDDCDHPALLKQRDRIRQVEVRMSTGTVDKMKGRMKEAAGALVGDNRLKQEGKADQLTGKVKDIAEKVTDTAKRVVKGR